MAHYFISQQSLRMKHQLEFFHTPTLLNNMKLKDITASRGVNMKIFYLS